MLEWEAYGALTRAISVAASALCYGLSLTARSGEFPAGFLGVILLCIVPISSAPTQQYRFSACQKKFRDCGGPRLVRRAVRRFVSLVALMSFHVPDPEASVALSLKRHDRVPDPP